MGINSCLIFLVSFSWLALHLSLAQGPQVGEEAPPIYVQDWVNSPAFAEIPKDQYMLLDFWATWCGPCIKSMPKLDELSEKFDGKIAFVSITNENKATAKEFLQRRKVKTIVVTDYQQKTNKEYQIQSIPQSYLISPSNTVIWKGHPSSLTEELLAKLISTPDGSSGNIVLKNMAKEEAEEERLLNKVIITETTEKQPSFFNQGQSLIVNDSLTNILIVTSGIPSTRLLLNLKPNAPYINAKVTLPEHNPSLAKRLLYENLKVQYNIEERKVMKEVDVWLMKFHDKGAYWDTLTIEHEEMPSSIVHNEKKQLIEFNNISVEEFRQYLENMLHVYLILDKDYKNKKIDLAIPFPGENKEQLLADLNKKGVSVSEIKRKVEFTELQQE